MGQSSSTRRKSGNAEKKSMTNSDKDNERPHDVGDVSIIESTERENGNETVILRDTDKHGCLPGEGAAKENRENKTRQRRMDEEFRYSDFHSQTTETKLADINCDTTSNNPESSQKICMVSKENLKLRTLAFPQWREFWEEQIDIKPFKPKEKEKKERHNCDACLSLYIYPEDIEKAFFLCTFCEKYLCQECFEGHEYNNAIKLNGDKNKNNQAIDTFIDTMIAEGVDRERLLYVEDISVCDRINVWHPLDEFGPDISGMCGLGTRRWVACDFNNDSIKVYKIGSNTLMRYIRFRSNVRGITEVIHPEYQTTNTVKCKESDDKTSSHEKCALAVSLSRKRQVLILGMDDNPVCKIGSIQTPYICFQIHYFDGQLFTYCRGPGSIYVMTVYGETLKKIPVGVIERLRFCVTPGRIYLTDKDRDRVILINFNGDLIYSKKIQHLSPRGVTVNDHGDVYVSSGKYNSIFKLDKNLQNSQTLCEKTNFSSPFTVLWYRNKLYVCHSKATLNDMPLTVMQFT